MKGIIMHQVYPLLSVLALLVIMLASSCEYEQRDAVDISDIPEVVSFSADVVPIFESKCTRCHGGTRPPDLTAENAYLSLTSGNYLDTEIPEESYLYKKIDGNGSMSEYADDHDRAVILKWIEQGAEEN